MNKGLLIAVCGLDGSGKTTQITMLAQSLKNRNIPITLTKQPSDYYRQDSRVRSYLDEGICPNMEALGMLAAADRKWHLSTIILPNLEQGINVITDRYLYSSLAFFKVRGLDLEYIHTLNKGVPEPDLTIFIDLLPEMSLERVIQRDGAAIKFEERDPSMFESIREAFLEVLPTNTLIINGALPKEIIHQQIIDKVNGILVERNLITDEI